MFWECMSGGKQLENEIISRIPWVNEWEICMNIIQLECYKLYTHSKYLCFNIQKIILITKVHYQILYTIFEAVKRTDESGVVQS